MHRNSLNSAKTTMDFQWRNIVLCTFNHLAQLLEQFILRNDREFLDCLSLKLTIYWIEHQTFCSIPPALDLIPSLGFYHLLISAVGQSTLPGRLGNHQLFKQCSPAFRGNLEEEVPTGESMDTKLELWPGLKFCIFYDELGTLPCTSSIEWRGDYIK